MSRSRKKTPIRGTTTTTSEKRNKRAANRKYRRITKVQVKLSNDLIIAVKESSNVWSFDKDGKHYMKNPSDKELRK